MFLPVAICVLAACLLSMLLTAWVCRVAPRLGLTDLPDGHRKLHLAPIPLGGGVAVFLATAVVIAAAVFVPNRFAVDVQRHGLLALGFLVSCTGVLALGLIDDRFGLRGRYKLLGQIAISGALVGITGLVIRRLGLFGLEIELGQFSVPFTLFWLVGAINAVNLLDGIDGLATTLGILMSTTLGIMAFLTGSPHVGLVALVLAGSLLGFLRYNFPPARVYLGDAGSMLIGLMLGALAILASLKGAGTVLLAAPLATLTLPILDSTAAIIRRRLTGRSVYSVDRAHLHHRLFHALGTNRRVLAVAALACAVTSAGALVAAATKHDMVAVLSGVGVVAIFVATGLFGRGELLLVAGRMHRAAGSLLRPLRSQLPGTVQTTVRLQGHEQWDLLWEDLTEMADRMNLIRMHLDVNLPTIHESYNATWDRHGPATQDERWQIDFPLCACGRAVGRLAATGYSNGGGMSEQVEEIALLIEPLEARLCAMVQPGLAATAPAPRPVAQPTPAPVAVTVPSRSGNGQATPAVATAVSKRPK